MKILYTSKSPLAGVCELMARCLNTYYEGEHEARVLNVGPGKHGWYLRDPEKGLVPTYSIKKKEHVDECLEWADVIHCMANVGVTYFNREDLLDKKLWVFQWHGAQCWPFERVFLPRHFSRVKWIHIGQGWIQSTEDQAKFFKPFFEKHGAKVVPNVITADDPLHLPKEPFHSRRDQVAFAPSQRHDGAVNGKGIVITERAIHGVKRDIIAGVKFEEALKRKRNSQLGIDEISTPMYHRSGLEFLSQGVPCICSYSADAERILKDATGAETMPFIQCAQGRGERLTKIVREFMSRESEAKRQAGVEARSWIENNYHPRAILQRHVDVYQKG